MLLFILAKTKDASSNQIQPTCFYLGAISIHQKAILFSYRDNMQLQTEMKGSNNKIE